MKNRSFFVVGALLLASLFTTSCDDLVSNFDNPVSSYLSVSEADVVIPTGDTYQIAAQTINSDKPITFKSSDETIVTVDEKGLVTGVADGEATITVSVEASEYYQAGELEVKVAVKRPLTFEALEDGNISVWFHGAVLEKPVVYSVNGEAKQEITTDKDITVSKGDKVEFWSANERLTQNDWNWGLQIHPNSQCAVYGNVMSMITPDGNYHTNKTITKDFALYGLLCGSYYWDDATEKFVFFTVAHDKYKLVLPATTLTTACYSHMLQETGFTEAPELPATELANYCYQHMFQECHNLTKVPKLPATELPEGCYGYMFQYCDGLIEAPAISVKSMDNYACQGMFSNCQKLKKANAITVEKDVKEYVFNNMFASCPELTEAPAITTETMDIYACYAMFYNCPKLTKAKAITVKTAKENAFGFMFAYCPEMTETPAITADSLGSQAAYNMFYGSQKLKKVNAINVRVLGPSAFQYVFQDKPVLEEVVAINAEKVYDNACYQMFTNCTQLAKVPATLPATTLAERCYSDMFSNCTSLKKAPALPATDLKSYCYNYMFGGCTALTEAPELKAATLAYGCYCAMFMNCSKLNKVTCLATTNAPDALGIWLAGAGTDASVTTRTLVRAEANTNWTNNDGWDWPSTNWYVPTGWTIDPAIPE